MVNMEIGPRCRVAYTTLRAKLMAEFSAAVLPDGRFITDFPGYIFYIGKNRNPELDEVLVFLLRNETNVEHTLRSSRGRMETDAAAKKLNLTLYDAKMVTLASGKESIQSAAEIQITLDLENSKNGPDKPKIDDMTFTQLCRELGDLERRIQSPISLKGLTVEQRLARKRTIEEQRANLMPVIFQIHRQVSFSFACFGFTLVGIPLGIRVHRRETNVGIAIALLLVAIYYSFILIGQALVLHPEFAPHLLVWIPNFLFQVTGAVLLWRANRGI
jgi:lipopolysaccharide export system permease protein